MRPAISWSELRGLRAGVWGLGVEGRANVRKLASLGVDPALVDDHPPADAPPGVLATSEGGLAALSTCDVVIKAPGISRYRSDVTGLDLQGIPVVGGLGLWLAEADLSHVVCITGTKGKSSTTAIATHLLQQWGYPCAAGGNLGVPPWDPDLPGPAPGYWMIETSSYQATDLACSPPVVAVTSLHPDHLDWHGDVNTYYRDKLSACSQPGADLTVASSDSGALRERAGLLGPRVQWVSSGDDPGAHWMDPLHLLGDHNRRNALIARACLVALGIPEASSETALAEAAAGFTPLASRLQVLGVIDGVTFVDDSLSTNVLPTLAALESFPGRRVALIAGGHDRGIDYGPLGTGLASRQAPTLLLTIPDNGPRIQAAVEAASPAAVTVASCADLAAATTQGFRWARPDGIVLLSPAAPSFGVFRDYRDRAEAFAAAMRECGPETGT